MTFLRWSTVACSPTRRPSSTWRQQIARTHQPPRRRTRWRKGHLREAGLLQQSLRLLIPQSWCLGKPVSRSQYLLQLAWNVPRRPSKKLPLELLACQESCGHVEKQAMPSSQDTNDHHAHSSGIGSRRIGADGAQVRSEMSREHNPALGFQSGISWLSFVHTNNASWHAENPVTRYLMCFLFVGKLSDHAQVLPGLPLFAVGFIESQPCAP